MEKQLRNWREAMDDPRSPECLRFFLKVASGPSLPEGRPRLFATLKRDFSGRLAAPVALRKGDRVRVTDAGKFGDVGITTHLDQGVICMARASVDELQDFGETA